MKGLKKLALASAVAAAPFAQAELVAMDDAVLADMTGQAGVSIELDTAVTISSFTYTDGDGFASASGNAGSVTMSGIAFGGAAVAGGTGAEDDARFDNVKIDIDVDATGGILMHLGAVDTAGVLDGSNTADFGLHIDSVTSSAAAGSVALASNINIGGNLGPVDVNINDTTGTGAVISVSAYFEVTTGEMDIDVIGLGVRNLRVFDDSNPFAADATYGALEAIGTGDDNWAKVAMQISTGSTTVTDQLGAATTIDSVLQVTVAEMAMDITADLTMGNVAGNVLTLGSIAIQDLDMSGTTVKIYGH
jgi:hypothetical protein